MKFRVKFPQVVAQKTEQLSGYFFLAAACSLWSLPVSALRYVTLCSLRHMS